MIQKLDVSTVLSDKIDRIEIRIDDLFDKIERDNTRLHNVMKDIGTTIELHELRIVKAESEMGSILKMTEDTRQFWMRWVLSIIAAVATAFAIKFII